MSKTFVVFHVLKARKRFLLSGDQTFLSSCQMVPHRKNLISNSTSLSSRHVSCADYYYYYYSIFSTNLLLLFDQRMVFFYSENCRRKKVDSFVLQSSWMVCLVSSC